MAGGFTVKIEGMRETDQALQELSRATAKNVGRKTLMEAGEPLAEAMQRAGKYRDRKGTLRRLIGVSTKLSRRQKRLHKKLDEKSGVEVFVGAAPLKQAHTTEFGTAHSEAFPWARTAWESMRMTVLDLILKGLRKNVDAAAKRAAAKAARLAAKGGR